MSRPPPWTRKPRRISTQLWMSLRIGKRLLSLRIDFPPLPPRTKFLCWKKASLPRMARTRSCCAPIGSIASFTNCNKGHRLNCRPLPLSQQAPLQYCARRRISRVRLYISCGQTLIKCDYPVVLPQKDTETRGILSALKAAADTHYFFPCYSV